jgi:hypothetical protein
MSDDWSNIQELDLYDVIHIIDKRTRIQSIEHYNKLESRLWSQYLVLFGNMDKKTYKPYEKFLKESGLKHPFIKDTQENINIKKNEVIDIALRIKGNDKRELKKKGGF